MKCPKCNYVSHDYLNTCRKCTTDLSRFKAQMQLYVVRAGNLDLRNAVGSMMPTPNIGDSGEFDLGGVLFEETAAPDATPDGNVFDINLEDDFNFTPSGMSLESLDGFEVSNLDMLESEQQAAEPGAPGGAMPDNPSPAAPETGYATVMMDISGISDEPPPALDSSPVDAPTGLADPSPVEPPANPEAGGSGNAPTAIFDLQGHDPLAGLNDTLSWDNADNERFDTLPDSAHTPAEHAEASTGPSEELILPSFDETGDAAGSATDSSASDANDAFTMPDLPAANAAEKEDEPLNPSEEFSLDMAPPAEPGPPPMDFPSIQSVVTPSQASNASPVQEASTPAEAEPPSTGKKTTYELDIADIQAPDELGLSAFDNTEPPPAESSHAATLIDELSPFATDRPAGGDAGAAPTPRSDTYEVDLSDIQAVNESAWPNLPERPSAFVPSSPHDSTIADQPSPFAAAGQDPTEPPDVNETDDDPDAPSSQTSR